MIVVNVITIIEFILKITSINQLQLQCYGNCISSVIMVICRDNDNIWQDETPGKLIKPPDPPPY